jgi:hypothetical protein
MAATWTARFAAWRGGLMKRRLRSMRKVALLLGLTGVLSLAFPVVATAVPPEHLPVEHVDETFTVEDCDFLVTVHVEGDVRSTVFFDQEGNEIRALDVFPNFRVTFTNAETGESITTPAPSVVHFTFNPDESVVLTVTGLSGHLIVGGGPPLASDVGRIVFFFSGPEDEEPDILFEAGMFSGGPIPELCDVLAP